MPLDLQVVTPERELLHEQVDEVQIPAKGGYLGVLPGHAPLLGELGIGLLSYTAGGRSRHLAIHQGFLEILEDHVRVLADVSERSEEIDVERARRALDRAQQQLTNPPIDVDPATALAAVERAQARIAANDRRQG
jgi:F-type H+-transporting ATPase subunit epsilon